MKIQRLTLAICVATFMATGINRAEASVLSTERFDSYHSAMANDSWCVDLFEFMEGFHACPSEEDMPSVPTSGSQFHLGGNFDFHSELYDLFDSNIPEETSPADHDEFMQSLELYLEEMEEEFCLFILNFFSYAPSPLEVPEPGTLSLLGIGGLSLLYRRRW